MGAISATHRREYAAWKGAIRMCTNPKDKSFRWYGGRGVAFCPQWMNSFETFLRDVGPKPTKGRLWLGRLDVNGNYEAGNVAWMPYRRQIRHRRSSHLLLTVNETFLSLEEVGATFGIPGKTLRDRMVVLNLGMEHSLRPGKLPFKKPRLLTFNGETLPLQDWAGRIGVASTTLKERIRSGMPLERALESGDLRLRKDSSP